VAPVLDAPSAVARSVDRGHQGWSTASSHPVPTERPGLAGPAADVPDLDRKPEPREPPTTHFRRQAPHRGSKFALYRDLGHDEDLDRQPPGRRGGVKVTVAVLTFRRTGYLAPLVSDLEREIRLLGAGSTARLLVVDNDPDGSGRAALESLSPSVDIACVVEPRPGIAAARNRALLECAEDDVLVFIDDDERPDHGWLHALLATREQHGPVAVSGPVRTVYGGHVDPWVEAGRFVDRSHHDRKRTGDLVTDAATNNLLLDLGTVRRLGLTFDESLRLSGGEDSLFTRQLTRAGGRIVWCAEAWVNDLRPGERTTRRAALRRAYSLANSETVAEVKLAGGGPASLRVRARVLCGGLVRVGAGAASYLVGSGTRRLPWQANGARLVARGLGATSAAVGLRHEYYAAQRSTPRVVGRFSGRRAARSPR